MNYIGSKKSLLEFIQSAVAKTHPDFSTLKIGDAFAGTHAVGCHFKWLGSTVFANDQQYYAYVLGMAQLAPKSITDIDFNKLTALNQPDVKAVGFITENYSPYNGQERMYFTVDNGQRIDGIRQRIEEWKESGDISELEYYYFLGCLLEAADKVANTASVYGAYLKQFKQTAKNDLHLQAIEVIPGPDVTISQGDATLAASKWEVDVLYLDPPYNTRQYHSNYHLLETIAKYDDPAIHGKTGLRSNDQHLKSDWSSKRTAADALDELLKVNDTSVVLLSYNSEGIIPLKEIERIFKQYGEYSRDEMDYGRFLSHKNKEKETIKEYIHRLVRK